MNKVINNTQISSCYECGGTGYAIGEGVRKKDAIRKICRYCNGSKTYKDTHFIIIAGNIAIDSDYQGK